MIALNDMLGMTMTSVTNVDDEKLVFVSNDGRRFQLAHSQDCCESVYIESIVGDLSDLVGEPLIRVEESTSNTNPEDVSMEYQGSFTWTFYKFATRKGYVDVRWYGESSGYYSESVEFNEITPYAQAARAATPKEQTLPVEIYGKLYDVPIAVQVYIVALKTAREKASTPIDCRTCAQFIEGPDVATNCLAHSICILGSNYEQMSPIQLW